MNLTSEDLSGNSAQEASRRSRARGCLLGQLAGDSLGSLVEFLSPEQIRRQYPHGVRELHDGGVWSTLAGQPTDDSEMALALARSLAARGAYDARAVREAYVAWLASEPFDKGSTITVALTGRPNLQSQANGSLMRISPLGIFGARHEAEQVLDWARQDAALTHPHPVCVQATQLYTLAIAHAVQTGAEAPELYEFVQDCARGLRVEEALAAALVGAADAPPADYLHQQGWVLIAFHNAFWHLIHTESAEEALVSTVMRGGDTDTNAAICGGLLGAVHGLDALPQPWIEAVLNCRPAPGPRVHHPRPEVYWPVDALELADALLGASA